MKKIALIMMMAVAVFCNADEFFNGLLGMDFGKKMEDPQRKDETKISFTPEKPYRGFKDYYVRVTPKTKIIYEIAMNQSFRDKGSAINEFDVSLKLLEDRYKIKAKVAGSSSFEFRFSKERYITVSLYSGYSNWVIISAYDSSIADQGKKEKLELEKSKGDASAL